jgi:ATP-binding cassette, subfamily B, bacterial
VTAPARALLQRTSVLSAVTRLAGGWRRMRPFVGISRVQLGALVVASIAAGLVEASLLALIATIGTALGTGAQELGVDLGVVDLHISLNGAFIVGFVLAAARAVLNAIVAYLPAAMSANAMASLRRQLFNAFLDTSWRVQATDRLGQFETVLTGHVGNASMAVVALGQALSSFAMFSALLVMALAISPPTALLLGLLSMSLFFVMRPLSRRTGGHSDALTRQATEYTQGSQEIVRLAEETQVFGASADYRRRFTDHIEGLRLPLLRTRYLSRLVPVLYQSLALTILLLALFVVSRATDAPLASLTAVVLLLVRSLAYGQELQASFTKMHELMPFMDRVRETIDRYRATPRQSGPDPLPVIRRLGMSDVGFSYTGTPVLRHIDFEVRAGEAIGIVGPSGAGKSTLVQILLRLREPDRGALVVNGDLDVRDVSLADWQRAVAYVPQAPQLMHGTVADNIRYHRAHVTLDDVVHAARLAHVHEDIVAMPDGYDTMLDDRTAPVSGGQKQRLCLARALAARPSVLVLDEPTSALDVRSEMLVQRSLESLKGRMTMFMVAHRMSTLFICDRVMVVVDGALDAFDDPERLRETNPYYRDATELTHRQSGAV